jgi:hypothetical protein
VASVTVHLSEVLESAPAEGGIASVGVGIRVETIVGVAGLGNVSDAVIPHAEVTLQLPEISSVGSINADLTLTGEKFDYAAFREQYDGRAA